MTHRRLEVLRVPILLDLLLELHLVHPREDLFRDVAHENNSCIFTEVLLLLDFDLDEAIFKLLHEFTCIPILLRALR